MLAGAGVVGGGASACGTSLHSSTLAMIALAPNDQNATHIGHIDDLLARACSKRVPAVSVGWWVDAGQQWQHAAKQHVSSRPNVTDHVLFGVSTHPFHSTLTRAARQRNKLLKSAFQSLKAGNAPVAMAARPRCRRDRCRRTETLLQPDGPVGKREKVGVQGRYSRGI